MLQGESGYALKAKEALLSERRRAAVLSGARPGERAEASWRTCMLTCRPPSATLIHSTAPEQLPVNSCVVPKLAPACSSCGRTSATHRQDPQKQRQGPGRDSPWQARALLPPAAACRRRCRPYVRRADRALLSCALHGAAQHPPSRMDDFVDAEASREAMRDPHLFIRFAEAREKAPLCLGSPAPPPDCCRQPTGRAALL